MTISGPQNSFLCICAEIFSMSKYHNIYILHNKMKEY